MARINKNKFCQLVAYDMGKTSKSVELYLDAIINGLVKEISRENSVLLDRFGVFETKHVGGYDGNFFGGKKYIDPRLGMSFRLTEQGINKVNKDILSDKEKKQFDKRVLNCKLNKSDKELLGIIEEKEFVQKDIREEVRKRVDLVLTKKEII